MAIEGTAGIDLAQLNDKFVAAEQFVHKAISNKSKLTKSLWRGMIGSGPFTYGEGYMKRKWSFYGGKALTGAAGDWYQLKDNNPDGGSGSESQDVEIAGELRDPLETNPSDRLTNITGTHRAQYNPQVVGYGFESKEYTLYETTRRTEDVNLRNLVFKWQFQQQMKLILDGLADITLGEWEKWLRETYVSFATKRIVMEGMGMKEFTIENAQNSNGIVHNAGLRTINLNGASITDIGRLTQDVLDYQYQYLSRQAVGGKSADGKNGMPVFTLVTSFETSTEIIRKDTERNRRMDYAMPEFHLEGYGTITGYQNWAHYHDIETPRYEVAADGASLQRVYPYESTPTNIGNAVDISMRYVTAPFELSIIFLKEVYRGLVPNNPKNVDKATFDGASNMGDFKWINIRNRETNLLGEIGFMFARFNCAPEPLDQVDNAICLLHRRESVVPITTPEVSDGTAPSPQAITMVAPVIYWEDDETATDYTGVEVLLAAEPSVQIGATVQITTVGSLHADGDFTTEDFVVVRDYTNGRYGLKLATGGTPAAIAEVIQSAIDEAGTANFIWS
jgi:hypothetical protein